MSDLTIKELKTEDEILEAFPVMRIYDHILTKLHIWN